jgi:hypothetical protein
MDPDKINGKGSRRFFDEIEVPVSDLLELPEPNKKKRDEIEHIATTFVGDSNNIDNRTWQIQSKLLKRFDPRFAVALCNDEITNDAMWLKSATILSSLATPRDKPNNFEGLLILSTSDGRKTFTPRRLLLLEGGNLVQKVADALPEITPEWYSVPKKSQSSWDSSTHVPVADLFQLLMAHRNVILKGVSGIGKSHAIRPIVEIFGEERSELVVFHPSSTYEDFVEALRPAGNGQTKVVDGRFLVFCKRAAADPDTNYLFIIDEINRAPAARVFGDLLYSVDPSKRVKATDAHAILSHGSSSPPPVALGLDSGPVALQLERSGPSGPYRALFCVPDNVYILATRNTSDHSIGGMDIALGRRFHTERLEPMTAAALSEVLNERGDPRLASIESEIEAWARMNLVLSTVSPDACLGHSYFFDAIRAADNAGEEEDGYWITHFLWRDYLLPQLTEILSTFDAGHLLPALLEAAALSVSATAGHWIEARGQGLDVAFVVYARPSAGPVSVDDGSPAVGEGVAVEPTDEDVAGEPTAEGTAPDPTLDV